MTAYMKTTSISLYIFIRTLGLLGILSMRSGIFKGIFFFFLAVVLSNEFKTFSKPCCKQMCSHLGFVVTFTEHNQSRFSPRICQNGKESLTATLSLQLLYPLTVK